MQRIVRAAPGPMAVWLAFALGLIPIASFAQVTLTLQFRDQAGQSLPVRAVVIAPTQTCPPVNPAAQLYQDLSAKSYFYCNGSAQVSVPAGLITIRCGRGFEYSSRDTTVNVSAPTTVVVTLQRFIDMKASGWYSGDTHAHITHQPALYNLGASDLLLAMQAEDVNYVNAMEEQANFTGLIDPLSQSDRIFQFSKEERNAHFGHLSLLGLRQWIADQGCAEQNVACGRTLNDIIHDMVNIQTGENAVIATHPFATYDVGDVSPWPGGGMWRGMPIDLAVGGVDAMDLLTYTNDRPPNCVMPYFHALNLGFHLPPSAGTDCTLSTGFSKPLAGYRMYVSTSGAFTMDSWIAGLKAGRSFVTNYPLFTHFDVEGKTMGETLKTNKNTLLGSVWVKCAVPFTKIEIIADTGVLSVLQPPAPAKSFSATFSIPRTGISWVVARATGPASTWHVIDANGLFAQTAPVYVAPKGPTELASGFVQQATGEPRIEGALFFLERLDELETEYAQHGYFPSQSQQAFDAAVAQARALYTGLLSISTGVPTPALRTPWELKAVWPNPSGGATHLVYRAPHNGGSHEVGVYDAAGRSVRRLFSGTRPGGDYELEWDGRDSGGARVASGVYFVRIRAAGATQVARKLVFVR
jgi:hypothetical protein